MPPTHCTHEVSGYVSGDDWLPAGKCLDAAHHMVDAQNRRWALWNACREGILQNLLLFLLLAAASIWRLTTAACVPYDWWVLKPTRTAQGGCNSAANFKHALNYASLTCATTLSFSDNRFVSRATSGLPNTCRISYVSQSALKVSVDFYQSPWSSTTCTQNHVLGFSQISLAVPYLGSSWIDELERIIKHNTEKIPKCLER